MRILGRSLVLGVSLVVVAGCSGDDGDASAEASRLRSEATALARAEGCTEVSECAVKAMGDALCGGPTGYLVYCTKTTDQGALDKKLQELLAADQKANKEDQENGVSGICSVPKAPTAEVVSGRCNAVGGSR